jgi:hypothetical protein
VRRADAHFAQTPAQDRSFGADPYDLAALDDGRLVGVLRGDDRLVLLDADLAPVAQVPTPRSPSAVTVYRGRRAGDLAPGDVLVTSEIEPLLARYRLEGRTLVRLPDVDLGGAIGVRDVATGPEGVVYVVEEHDDRLITLRFGAGSRPARHEQKAGRGPFRIRRTRRALFVLSLLDHALTAYRLGADGSPGEPSARVENDGPFWGFDAVDHGDDAWILAGGVEDHPLDRTGGFFGYVDSFVYAYRYVDSVKKGAGGEAARLERASALDVSEHGSIVPKAIAFDPAADTPTALVTSYGAATALRVVLPEGHIEKVTALPGDSALVATPRGFVGANPLLDAWVDFDREGAVRRLVHVSPEGRRDERTDDERLGEALFFTGLMAPASSADGAMSRFSCETCHFEGYVDGRTHHTGRGDVRATTKPLVGLFNNRPHFSRALDPDLSAVAENEFRVAGAPASRDPHFDLDAAATPWLGELGAAVRPYPATELRVALMSFLMRWTHRTNPRAAGRSSPSFVPAERRGARVFAERCERCHEARTAADDPSSRVPLERWETFLLGDDGGGGPIVWACDAYAKTGIAPYVHERGARVPSLRRLYKKRPYFTNGSAPDILTVLRRARFAADGFSHSENASGDGLDDDDVRDLAAFLDVL